ncbi:MAG TPA: condensation domain-containing protein, partial [Verrucomicrobiae bacterium]|nr:condensation domain-containing protein [Verrucomicrobiae bacterium]
MVAYFVARVLPPPRVGEVSGFLRTKLPGYMVPAAFILLNELPLTPAGKIDRRALPSPGNTRPELDQEYVPPRLPIEEALAAIWSEVLDLKPIGVHDRFFDLGGDSLLAIQVISRIRDTLQTEVPLGQFFNQPTIAGLARLISEGGLARPPQLPVSVLSSGASIPLSAKQRRIWVLEQFHPQRSPYNRVVGLKLQGALNRGALEKALSALAQRHEALRAVFPSSRGEPSQFICAPQEVVLATVDFTNVPPEQRESQARARAGQEARRPYIGFHPVLRPVLLRLSDQEHWLLLVLHEIAADSRSARVVVDELLELYGAFVAQKPSALRPLSPHYSEAVLEEERVSGPEEQAQIDYWVRRLQDAPALLELPTDNPRPARTPGTGARQPVLLPAPLAEALEKLGREQGCDLFTVLFAGFYALLHRYSLAEDMVIGTLAAKPRREELEQLVVNFERPLALRCNLAGDPTFIELLARVRETVGEAIAHSDLPFAKLIDLLQPERHGSFARVFQVMFVLEQGCPAGGESGGLRFSTFEIDNETAKLDLSLRLVQTGQGLSGWFEYSTPLFEPGRIERMVQHLKVLLSSAVATPSVSVSRLVMLPEAEREQVLIEWNRTEKNHPVSKTLVDLFREQAQRTPDAEALVCGTERVTYRELESRAAVLARQLLRRGLKREEPVGICLDRSPDMVVSILATLFAGGAYVPLDPAYPQDRLTA